jgi:subtilisin family serine protease
MKCLRGALVAGLLGGAVVAPGGVWARGGKAARPVLAGEILIKLQSPAVLPALLDTYALTVIDQFGARPIYRLSIDPAQNLNTVIEALHAEIGVLIAEPNYQHSSPEARKNNAWAIGEPGAYATQWAPQALHLADAHRLSRGAGVRVAVLDTGVDRAHPDLAGRLLPGFDFVDFDSDPSEATDPGAIAYGHGTHVAGLVALVAPDATIMPLRVLDAAGVGNAWVLAEAMLYAADPDGDPATDDGAQVVNLSLGSAGRTQLLDTITKLVTCAVPDPAEPAEDLSDPGYANDKARCARHGGAVVAAAAGNDGSRRVREYPAAEGAYGLIAVTASTADERLARFANSGNWIHVAAPGEGLTSSVPGGGYGSWSGTSMAAPLVAGTAALLRALDPALTPDLIVDRLLDRSVGLCGTVLRRIDAAAALTPAGPPAPWPVCR